ncbi:MAG: hypothetical protein EAZ43_01265 [Betaproteobacteria bacterium]|nr:MAG: hypothetical protein EAZ43_01265 [Betaproteobacteria bacterium]
MSRAKLEKELTEILRDHLGVAAEFVVEDALAELDSHTEWAAFPKLRDGQFLNILGRHLPPEVPYARLRQQVIESVERHSTKKE